MNSSCSSGHTRETVMEDSLIAQQIQCEEMIRSEQERWRIENSDKKLAESIQQLESIRAMLKRKEYRNKKKLATMFLSSSGSNCNNNNSSNNINDRSNNSNNEDDLLAELMQEVECLKLDRKIVKKKINQLMNSNTKCSSAEDYILKKYLKNELTSLNIEHQAEEQLPNVHIQKYSYHVPNSECATRLPRQIMQNQKPTTLLQQTSQQQLICQQTFHEIFPSQQHHHQQQHQQNQQQQRHYHQQTPGQQHWKQHQILLEGSQQHSNLKPPSSSLVQTSNNFLFPVNNHEADQHVLGINEGKRSNIPGENGFRNSDITNRNNISNNAKDDYITYINKADDGPHNIKINDNLNMNANADIIFTNHNFPEGNENLGRSSSNMIENKSNSIIDRSSNIAFEERNKNNMDLKNCTSNDLSLPIEELSPETHGKSQQMHADGTTFPDHSILSHNIFAAIDPTFVNNKTDNSKSITPCDNNVNIIRRGKLLMPCENYCRLEDIQVRPTTKQQHPQQQPQQNKMDGAFYLVHGQKRSSVHTKRGRSVDDRVVVADVDHRVDVDLYSGNQRQCKQQ
ncbi:hypothetical protein HELRODRAFT_162182 [Helobdella robusta]|uniref:Uncharacterized protein n=1 Tax=Helobdella robusta TaxID=6412 RepID=T1ESC0_HELRO|nr:hypothetical protein HELRODRAFT_162182 [Helobdella robusta]ESN98731.1 hypothetical protein HELRODRAFT_162182 [Helobdella robusta]